MWSGGFVVFLGVVLVFLSVAFVTLFERKVLALSQVRKGPNKVVFGGVFQPVIDGVKLLYKGVLEPFQSSYVSFFGGPTVIILVMSMVWGSLCTLPFHSSFLVGVFWLVLILGLGVYGVFFVGLSGMSKYSLIGGIRAAAQNISYEVSFILVVFSVVSLFQRSGLEVWSSFLFIGGFSLWLVSYVAEVNRAPFDFAEGESELISGFNLELSSLGLAYVFVGEYGMLVLFSWVSSIVFLGGAIVAAVGLVFVGLGLRSAFPRFRYDKLMFFCWGKVLPLGIFWSVFCYMVSSS